MIRIALDTNILVYAEGLNGAQRKRAALNLIQKLPDNAVLLPAQVLGELFNVLVRKGHKSSQAAGGLVLNWYESFPVLETSSRVMLTAIELAGKNKLGIWDSIVLATAASAGCRLLLSEDLHDGFTWNGVTVANPFAVSKQPSLVALLKTV